MPEVKSYTFDHNELAEILIKKLDIHEGLWGVYIEFGFSAANVGAPPDAKTVTPAALSLVNKIGIQRFDAPNNLTVDAAQVNPAKRTKALKQNPPQRWPQRTDSQPQSRKSPEPEPKPTPAKPKRLYNL
jgi:hypothetical protein